jgi:hypothetical protein
MSEAALVERPADPIVEARAVLRGAHGMRREAEARHVEAQKAHVRGVELVFEHQAELDALDRQAEELAGRHAEAIAAGVRSGVALAVESDTGVAERLEARAKVVYELATAQAAARYLADDVQAAELAFKRARFAVQDAAAGLLRAIGEDVAQETLAAETLARDSRHRLEGLARLWVSQSEGGPPSALRLGRKAMGVLGDVPLNDSRRQYPASQDPSSASRALWQALAASLLRDPEAKEEE